MSRNKVLVVDDESGVRFGIRDFLEQHGYEIEEADSCEDAQHLFRTSRPDIVIADYMLPDGTALDLLPRLKEIDSRHSASSLNCSWFDRSGGPGDKGRRRTVSDQTSGAACTGSHPYEATSKTAKPSQATGQQVTADPTGDRSIYRH